MTLPHRDLRVVGDAQADSEIDLIMIAGIGTSPVERWAIITPWWREFLATTDSKVRMLAFDHPIAANDEVVLDTFSEQADVLLEVLSLHLQKHANKRPLLFMCHSLGSIILKQALGKANAQSHQYTSLLHALLGVVFLGAPHSAADPELLAESVLGILRSVPNGVVVKQASTRLEELRRLSMTSQLFQDTQLRIEILSLYENETTKVRIGRTEGRSKMTFNVKTWKDLVDERLARTMTGHEQCYSLAGNHDDLCKLLEEQPRRPDHRMRTWFQFVLSMTARLDVEHHLQSAQLPESPHLTGTSLSSWDMTKLVL
nr:hypothetical protein B0A51_13884 [Rachicladosporium sp. CCFEE 5018]